MEAQNNYNLDDDRIPLNSQNPENNRHTNMEENLENNQQQNNQQDNQQQTLQTQPWSRRRIIVTIFRSSLVFIALVVVFLNTIFGFVLPSGNVDCVIDYTHKGTSSVNQALIDNVALRKALMILSALFLDIIFLTKIGYFIFRSRTWRLIVAIVLFFLVRSIAQVIFQERIPEGYAWYYPGFPSITVSYLKANDFYFNSSTGLLLICGLAYSLYVGIIFPGFNLFYKCIKRDTQVVPQKEKVDKSDSRYIYELKGLYIQG